MRAQIVLGLVRLTLRARWLARVELVLSGLVFPLIVVGVLWPRAEPAQRGRLLLGATVFSALVLLGRQLGTDLAAERASGARRLFAATRATFADYLLAHALGAALLLPLAVSILGLALLTGRLDPPASAAWVIPFALAAGAFAMLGILIGLSSPHVAAVGLRLNLLVATGLAFCPMIYPADRVPSALRAVVGPLPMSLGAELCWQAWATGQVASAPLALLAAWTLGLAAWVAWRARGARFAD
jgi:hypothetical protein